MRARRPVIATDHGDLEGLVDDSTTGLLVPARDPRAAAVAIQRLVDDVDLRQKMGSVGHEVFEENFSRSAMVERFAFLYAQVRNGG